MVKYVFTSISNYVKLYLQKVMLIRQMLSTLRIAAPAAAPMHWTATKKRALRSLICPAEKSPRVMAGLM